MTNRALSRRLAITLALFALYTIGRFGIDQIRPPGMIPNDYMNFHKASDRLARGAEIYVPADESPYKYSPTFIVTFRETFDRLPHAWAWALWCALSILGFAWATHWLWTRILPAGTPGRRLAWLVGLFGLCAWHGYLEHFSYGQGDMFLYSLFVAAVAASTATKARPWTADVLPAVLMSGLIVMKPQSAILLAYFLMGRRFRILALTAAGTAALLLAPAAGWGWVRQLEMFQRWRIVLANQSVDFLTGNLNQSVAASAARLLGRRELVRVLTPVLLGLGAAAAFVLALVRPLKRSAPASACAWRAVGTLLLYALVSPLSWRWSTFVWLPIGVALALAALRARRGPARSTALAALGLFTLNGVFLQTFVAHLLGVAEIDELSRLGLYCLGNALLCVAYLALSLPRRA
jgi:hypothetical protein